MERIKVIEESETYVIREHINAGNVTYVASDYMCQVLARASSLQELKNKLAIKQCRQTILQIDSNWLELGA